MAQRNLSIMDKMAMLRSARRRVRTVPFVWPEHRSEQPQWHITDFESYAEEGYNQNMLVYSAIMYKVRALYQLPLRAYTGDPEHPDPLPVSHPLSMLTSRPNPYQSFIEFQGLSTVYLNLDGNCYILIVRDDSGTPYRMYTLRPDRIFVIPSNSLKNLEEDDPGLVNYLYVPEGRAAWQRMTVEDRQRALASGDAFPILAKDLMHVKLPNPSDPLEGLGYGLSPLSPGARSADVDNKVTKFLKLFFDRGAMFQGILSYQVPLDPTDIPRIRERWNELYGGYENWAEVGILDQGGKYERITPTFDEMGFGEIDYRNESRVLGPFGVPPILIGSRIGLDRATYANYKEAREACWQDTLVPESRLFEVEYQHYLGSLEEETFVAYDYANVPALRADINELSRAWINLVKHGVPKDIASQITRLPIKPLPDGDVQYMVTSLVPVDEEGRPLYGPNSEEAIQREEERFQAEQERAEAQAEAQAQAQAEAQEQEDETVANGNDAETEDVKPDPDEEAKRWAVKKKLTESAKDELGIKSDQIARSWESRLAAISEQRLREDLDLLLLGNMFDIHMLWRSQRREIQERWYLALIPIVLMMAHEQMEMLISILGPIDVDPYDEDWARSVLREIVPIIYTTTLIAITKLVEQAQREGWSTTQIRDRLYQIFDQWMTGSAPPEAFSDLEMPTPNHRAKLMSETESVLIAGMAALAFYIAQGYVDVQWWTMEDERVCPWCGALHGTIVGSMEAWFTPGEIFTIGSAELAIVRTIISPPLHVRCRCFLVPA